MATFTLSPEYGYVLLTATSTLFLSFWHSARIGPFRKAAKVPYPICYADTTMLASASSPEQKHALYLFNCAQRAHGNFLENHAPTLAALMVAGLRYPVAASVLGAAWGVARLAYAVGYTDPKRQDGKGRLVGLPMWLFQLGLYGMAGTVGYKMLVGA